MRFILGFVIGVVAIVVAGLLYVRFGYVDPRADIPVNSVEEKIAMPALDASVDRHAPELKNPADATDANLTSGMQVYQLNCASCHGDINHHQAMFADAFYPRAPQFLEDAPDMPDNQNFYIIQHGVRLSGMPAWSKLLTDQQMWQVTTFLSHMDKLPPAVSTQWQSMAGSSSTPAPASPK